MTDDPRTFLVEGERAYQVVSQNKAQNDEKLLFVYATSFEGAHAQADERWPHKDGWSHHITDLDTRPDGEPLLPEDHFFDQDFDPKWEER